MMSKKHDDEFKEVFRKSQTVDEDMRLYRLQYKLHWRDKSQLYWAYRLAQEVLELFFALIGLHKHSIESELAQIAGICTNWLEYRNEQAAQ